MGSIMTNRCRELLLAHEVDLLGDVLKALLLTTGYVPDPDHATAADVATWECSGIGYTAGWGGSGRKVLTGKSVVRVDGSDYATLLADDLLYAALNVGRVGYVAIVKAVTSDALSPLLGVLAFETPAQTDSGDWTLAWPADGVLRLGT